MKYHLMKNTMKIIFIFICLNNVFCFAQHKFQDTNLLIEERADDLISKLTLEEKVQQLMDNTPAIPRLGVSKYSWWNECLHGLARNGKATVFPQAIGLGATFDEDLMFRIGEAIALEARAKFNINRKNDYMDRYAGLTFWSPNVNVFRDPRWGRGQETYGEDPTHIAKMGSAFVRGLQGDGKILKVAAMAKHYAVHNGPEKLRHEFNAVSSNYDLWNTYLPAFETLIVDAKVEGVMGAYNRTNGDACIANDFLMGDILRDRWKFNGYFVSDCGALRDLYGGHRIVETKAAAAALALNKGCNLNCGKTYTALEESIKLGLTSEEEVDKNLKQLLLTRFRLGLFDPVGSVVFDKIKPNVIRSKEHIQLAHEAAKKSIVLLKNEDNILPLNPNVKSLYVTGPTAANIQALLANYYGVSDDLKTILEGVVNNVSDQTAIRYVQGALLDRPNVNPKDWFSSQAEESEVTIVCLGITQLLEGEEGEAIASASYGDRDYINLPPSQIEFLKVIRSKAKKLVVVITGGSAISSPEVHEMADAILYAWYPGEQGGQAVGDVIFGKHSPSGKLPVSFVNDLTDLPPYEDYAMKNRTYRYFEGDLLYPFGFGLSYADISIENTEVSNNKIESEKTVIISINLKNNSDFDADEVVQIYVKDKKTSNLLISPELKRFSRTTIEKKSSKNIKIELGNEVFSTRNEKGILKFTPGDYEVFVGLSAPVNRSKILGAPKWIKMNIKAKK